MKLLIMSLSPASCFSSFLGPEVLLSTLILISYFLYGGILSSTYIQNNR